MGAFTSREKKTEVDSVETELDSKKREFDERLQSNISNSLKMNVL